MGLQNRKFPLASEMVFTQKVVLAAADDDEKIILDFTAEADIVEVIDFTFTQLIAGSAGAATVTYRIMADRGTDIALTAFTAAQQIDAVKGITDTADGLPVNLVRGEIILLDVNYDVPAAQTGGTILVSIRYRR